MTIPPNLDGRDGGETTLRTLVRDPVRLAYHETGSGSPPLVFLHGWGGNHGWVNRPVGLVSVAVSVEGVSEGKGE